MANLLPIAFEGTPVGHDSWILSQLTVDGHTFGSVYDDRNPAPDLSSYDGYLLLPSTNAANWGSKLKGSAKPGFVCMGNSGGISTGMALGSSSAVTGRDWTITDAGDLDAALTGNRQVYTTASAGARRLTSLPTGSVPIAFNGASSSSNPVCVYYPTGITLTDGSTVLTAPRWYQSTPPDSTTYPLSSVASGTFWIDLLSNAITELAVATAGPPSLSIDDTSPDVPGGATFEFTPTGSGGAGGPFTYTAVRSAGDDIPLNFTDGTYYGRAPLTSGASVSYSVTAIDSAATPSTPQTVTVTATSTRTRKGIGTPTVSTGWTDDVGGALTAAQMATALNAGSAIYSSTGQPFEAPIETLPLTTTATGWSLVFETKLDGSGSVTAQLKDGGVNLGSPTVVTGVPGEWVFVDVNISTHHAVINGASDISIRLTSGA